MPNREGVRGDPRPEKFPSVAKGPYQTRMIEATPAK